MATEVINNIPEAEKEKEKEPKDDAAPDNEQTKEEAPAAEDKAEGKVEEKKAEPAPPKPNVHKVNFEQDVVYLYQFPRTPVLPSTSPYCLKVETWLRLAGIKYENVDHKAKFRSKKGQLPFIELNGEEIADSALIIKELSEKYNKDLDAGLSAERRAVAHAMISMIENHLSWVIFWWRARYPDSVLKGYRMNLQSALDTRLPTPILNFCYKFNCGRKGMKKAKAHGIGVHSQDEIIEFGKSDLRVLSDLLADKPFFFGDEPTLLDVVAFANLAQLQFLEGGVPHALRDALSALPGLAALVTRLRERAFPDWEALCAPAPAPPAKQAPAEEPEKGKGDEKEKEQEKEQEKEPEEKEKEKEEKEK